MQLNIEITQETIEAAEAAKGELEAARAYSVTTPEQMMAAGEDLKRIKGRQKDLEERRLAQTRPLDTEKKRIMDFFRAPMQFLDDAERLLKRAILGFQNEQERIRREAEARLQEQQRREAAKLEKRAEAAASKGQTEKAEALRDQAASMPTPVVAHAAPTVAGISSRSTFRAEVFDLKALALAVAEGQVPEALIEPNMKALNAQARTLKGAMNYPGVRVVEEKTLAAASA